MTPIAVAALFQIEQGGDRLLPQAAQTIQLAGQDNMQISSSSRMKKQESRHSVISSSSILIISAFLIGVAAGKSADPTVAMGLYLLGAFGCVAYFGLGYLARQRRERAVQRKKQRAAKKLEVRMGRHIPTPATPEMAEPLPPERNGNRQLVAIVEAH